MYKVTLPARLALGKRDLKLLRKWFLVLVKCCFPFSFDLLTSLSLAWRQQVCLSENRDLYSWKSVGFQYPVMIVISVIFMNEEVLIPAVLATLFQSCSPSASLRWQNHLWEDVIAKERWAILTSFFPSSGENGCARLFLQSEFPAFACEPLIFNVTHSI